MISPKPHLSSVALDPVNAVPALNVTKLRRITLLRANNALASALPSASLGTCGVSLDGCLDFSLTTAAAGCSPPQHTLYSRSRVLAQDLVRLIRPHFVPFASWGIPSRGGLALPISLCGCSSIPVRGGSRIASLHQHHVVSSSTPAAIFPASLLAILPTLYPRSNSSRRRCCSHWSAILSQSLYPTLPGSIMAP